MIAAPLFQVIYTSRSRIGGDATTLRREVAEILEAARRDNARDGITGALLYNHVGFAQVLEGPLPAVTATFERIQRDSRHGDVVVLASGAIAARAFADWRMGLADPLAPETGSLDLGAASAEGIVALLASVVGQAAAWPA